MFHTFLSMHFQILATTRSHIADTVCYKVNELENIDDLKQLFFAYAPSAKQHPEITADIIEEVYRHTLTVELAAKTLTASGMDVPYYNALLNTIESIYRNIKLDDAE